MTLNTHKLKLTLDESFSSLSEVLEKLISERDNATGEDKTSLRRITRNLEKSMTSLDEAQILLGQYADNQVMKAFVIALDKF